MTKTVAEKIAKGITDNIQCNTTDIDDWAEFWGFTREEYEEFFDMTIKVLEQESCEDAISRQQVLKQLKGCLTGGEAEYNYVKIHIDSIPSVAPKLKTGHWIEGQKGLHVTSYKCSECGRIVRDDTGYDVNVDYPFCHCGAKMIEPQGSEG